MLSDNELLQQVSRALPLKGIILDESSYQLCETVLSSKSRFTFQTYLPSNEPRIKKQFEYRTVKTKKEIERFIETTFTKYPIHLKDFKETFRSIIKQENNRNQSKAYFGLTKYFVQYYKYCTVDINKCFLTATCVDELKTLERCCQTLDDSVQHELCEKVFEKFGTHINTGNLHYGGIYILLLHCYICDDGDKEIDKDLVTSLDELSVANIEEFQDIKKEIMGMHNNVEDIIVHIKTSNNCTQMKLDSWMQHLENNNSDWRVFELEKNDNFVGIWDLLENHTTSFADPQIFRTTLATSSEMFYWNRKRKAAVLKSVRHYSNDPHLYIYAKIYLVNIIDWKYEFETKNSSLRLWWQVLLSKEMEAFLTVIVECIPSFYKTNVFYIKSYIKNILEEALDRLPANKEVKHLSQWIEDVPSFDIINQAVYDYHLALFCIDVRINILPLFHCANDNQISRVKTGVMIDAVKHTLTVLENMGAEKAITFMNLIIYDLNYDIDKELFTHDLTSKLLENFLEIFDRKSNEFNRFFKEGRTKVELFLIALAIEFAGNKSVQTFEGFQGILKNIFKEGETKISIKQYIDANLTDTFEEFKTLIYERLYGKETGQNKEEENKFISSFLTEELPENLYNETENDVKPLEINVITKLGLRNFYPNKITIDEVREHSTINKVKKVEDIPWCYLNSVISLDYNLWENFKVEQYENDSISIEERLSLPISPSSLQDITRTQPTHDEIYHPLDITVAVFLCCTRDLKQLIVDKLYFCRIGVPLFFKDEVSNNFILQSSGIPILDSSNGNNNAPIISETLPVIAFIRMNDLSISKTELINSLLDNRSHHSFFHKNLFEEDIERSISNGLVSITRYSPPRVYPQGSSIFLNLRGNGYVYKESLEIVLKFSDIFYVFLELETNDVNNLNIEEILRYSKRIVFVFTKNNKFNMSDFKIKYESFLDSLGSLSDQLIKGTLFNFEFTSNGCKKKPQKIRREFHDSIYKNVTDVLKPVSLEERMEGLDFNESYRDGNLWNYSKKKADYLSSLMSKYEVSFIKDNIFPLQGDLWIKWGQLERDIKICRPIEIRNEKLEENITRLNKEKAKLRLEQRAKFNEKSNEIIKTICSNIINLDTKTLKYLFLWLTYYLRKLMQNKNVEYCQNQSQENDQMNQIGGNIKDEIENIELNENHIFRELAQVYEAFLSLKYPSNKMMDKLESIPRVMAELFLHGTTLELLDGSANHIPINFIQSVFKHLQEKVNTCVYVISAIGVQSTGKSTLLNTLFGTQFPIDSGTCTQGVNAQLIKVPSSSPQHKGFYYIMVLDTEGMRSKGIDMLSKDNELATLVAGISDITIVNFKGESQTEMEEILQIITHSLVKVKAINTSLQLNTSYLFIYHNVEAVDASQKLRKENIKLLNKLDIIIKDSSTRLGIENIHTFSQNTSFDIDKDIFYFPNIWDGVPPMATVSREYTRRVKHIKEYILTEKISHVSNNFDFEQFSTRLNDLWKGILREYFVFSFRNCLEINAFNSLERTFNKLKWDLNEECILLLHGMEANIDRFSLNEEQIKLKIEKKYESKEEELKEFFSKKKDGKLLIKHAEKYHSKFSNEKDNIVLSMINALNDKITVQRIKDEYKEKLFEWKREARNKAIEVAEITRLANRKRNEEELKYEFDRLWLHLKSSLPPMNIKEDNVDLIIDNILRELFQSNISLYEQQYKLNVHSSDSLNYENDHVSDEQEDMTPEQYKENIKINIKINIDAFVKKIENNNFMKNHAEKAVQIVINELDCWSEVERNFKLTDLDRIDMVLLTMSYVSPEFKKMQKKFKNKVSPFYELEPRFKFELEILYFNTFYEIEFEQTTATIFSDVLNQLTKIKIEKEYFAYKRTRQKEMNLVTKKDLMIKVLQDLLKEDSFQEYMLYIQDMESYLCNRFFKILDEYISNDHDLMQRLTTAYNSLLTDISCCLGQIEERMNESNDEIKLTDWIGLFYQETIHLFPDIRENTKDLFAYSRDCEFNTHNFHLFLQNSFNNILPCWEYTSSHNYTQFDLFNDRIKESFTSFIRGCNKKCPFCRASCLSSINDHNNKCSTTHHFPIGISGGRYQNNTILSPHTCSVLISSENRFANDDTKDLQVSIFRKLLNLIMYGDALYEHNVLPFKKYQVVYDTWHIDGDDSLETSLYWKWFVVKYRSKLEEYYNAKFQYVPTCWESISKQDALISLENM